MYKPFHQAYKNSISKKIITKLTSSISESSILKQIKEEPKRMDMLSSSIIINHSLKFIANFLQRILSLFKSGSTGQANDMPSSSFKKRTVPYISSFIISFMSANTLVIIFKDGDIFRTIFQLIIIFIFLPGLFIRIDLRAVWKASFFGRILGE